MGRLLFHCCSTNTYSYSRSFLCAVTITVVWCGVVGLSRRRFGALLDASVALLPVVTALVLHRKVLSIYRPLLYCLLCAGCFVERAASHTHHFSAVVVAVLLCIQILHHEHRVMCSEECLNSTVVVLHAEQSALISSPHFRRVLNFSRSDVSKNHAVNT